MIQRSFFYITTLLNTVKYVALEAKSPTFTTIVTGFMNKTVTGEDYSLPCMVYSQHPEFLQLSPRDDHLFQNHTFLCCPTYLAGCLMASHLKHCNNHDKRHKLTKQEVISGALDI